MIYFNTSFEPILIISVVSKSFFYSLCKIQGQSIRPFNSSNTSFLFLQIAQFPNFQLRFSFFVVVFHFPYSISCQFLVSSISSILSPVLFPLFSPYFRSYLLLAWDSIICPSSYPGLLFTIPLFKSSELRVLISPLLHKGFHSSHSYLNFSTYH